MTTKVHLHEKLKITFPELLALFGVREALKRNLLKHVGKRQVGSQAQAILTIGSDHGFNMLWPGCTNEDCGSVGCIGGYMAIVLGNSIGQYVNAGGYNGGHSISLKPLFFPPDEVAYEKVRPAHALEAIERFLAGKKPWAHVKA